MARIRQIKPEFYFDEELALGCEIIARYFFIGLWKETDREGRVEDRPAKLKAQIFPYDNGITTLEIVKFIDQLEAGGWVVRYQVDGRHLLWVRTFKEHQHFHKDEQASKLPEPPQDIKIHRTSTMHTPLLHPTCTPTSTSTSGNLVSGIGEAPKGAQPVARRRRTSQKTGCPESFEIDESLKDWASKAVPGLNLEAETEDWLDYHRQHGHSFTDWEAVWRRGMRRSYKWMMERNNGKGKGILVGTGENVTPTEAEKLQGLYTAHLLAKDPEKLTPEELQWLELHAQKEAS